MKILFKLKSETKTCYRFENQEGGRDTMQTLYLKKDTLKNAKIKPDNGLWITMEEAEQ